MKSRYLQSTISKSILIKLLVITASLLLAACNGEKSKLADIAKAQESIQSSGEVVAARSRSITPPQFENTWNVKIAMLKKDGSRIKTGMPIVKFDTQDLMEKLRTSKASVDKKNKELEQHQLMAKELLEDLQLAVNEKQSNLEKARMKADIPDALLANKDYKRNQLNMELAKLERERALTALKLETKLQAIEKKVLENEQQKLSNKVVLLESDIAKATVFAEGEGIFVIGRDHRGNQVKVGDQVWRGRTVAEIPDMRSLQVLLEIPEREAAKVKMGQRVRFRLDAKPEVHFEGTIASRGSVVRNRSSNQPAKVFDAEVGINTLDPELMRPGMRVTADIFIHQSGTE